MKTNNFSKLMKIQLEELGLDVTSKSLRKTPKRAAKAFNEMTKFHRKSDAVEKLFVLFPASNSQLVVVSPIFFGSICEHHILPFFGFVHIGYIPKDQILGLSKFKRIIDLITRQITVQEKLTSDIFDLFEKHLQPKALIVVVEAQHSCLLLRGAKDSQAIMKTSFNSEFFNKNHSQLQSFFNLIKHYE